MKRVIILLVLMVSALLMASCDPRMAERKPVYDPQKCPVCVQKPGVCFHCDGSGKCPNCKGTGKFTASTKNYPEKEIVATSYTEACPFCSGSGTCSHCKGEKKCDKCLGTGKVSDWNFGGKYETKIAAPAPAEPAVPAEPVR